MLPADACVSIVVLSEDAGPDGRATVEALVRKMLDLVPSEHRARDRVVFLPLDPHEGEVMPSGSVWKSKTPTDHDARVRLQRFVARKLSQAGTYVVFHVDGDQPWSKRAKSPQRDEFDQFKVRVAQSADRGRARVANARRSTTKAESDAALELHIDRLVLLCPFRNIEAWLYQNVQCAIEICRRKHGGRHVEALRAWEAKRHELDELEPPELHGCFKDCVHKKHNHELASKGFPIRVAYDVKKSFAESADRLIAALLQALPGH